MAAPKWFDKSYYLTSKLEVMREQVGYENLSMNSLKTMFHEAGYDPTSADSLYAHFTRYGHAENVSPDSYFDVDYYFQSKAADYYNVNIAQVTDSQVQFIKQAFSKAGLSAWDHYLKYGMKEGIDPNANFNTNKYMEAKLAQMQETDPSYTMDQLLDAFKAANLNPVQHYFSYGQSEGLTLSPASHAETIHELKAGVDNVSGTIGDPHFDEATGVLTVDDTYDDYFHAEVGNLQSDDKVDGLGGVDTLYAIVDARNSSNSKAGSINPTVKNVEKVLFQSQIGDGDDYDSAPKKAAVSAVIDADRISLAHKGEDGYTGNLILGSVNSRADLRIEDVRHFSNETTIRFADADPAIGYHVYFDPQHLKADDATTSGNLYVELMDVFKADIDKKPLETNPYNEFKFYYTNGGIQKLVDLKFLASDESLYTGDATYDDLVKAFNNALADQYPELVDQLTIEKGATFTAQAYSSTDHQLHSADGNYVKISSKDGTVTCPSDGVCGWKTDKTVPPDTNYDTRVTTDSDTSCPLITVDVELTNVGRVQWDDASECLPDDLIKGSNADDLQIGSMSMRSGIERMDVFVDEGSWLSGLYSTNDTLRMVTVAARDINDDGIMGNKGQHRSQDAHMADDTVNGQLFIGTWVKGKLDDNGNGYNNLTWADKAHLLEANKIDNSGLNDVAVFDAEESGNSYTGDINIAANITEASYDKYLKGVDYYLDDNGKVIKNAPLDGARYEGAFSYFTSAGNDTVNMTVDGDIAADVDFKMNIKTSSGNDLVAFQYNDMTPHQNINNKYMQQVAISTDTGEDTVWFYGAKVEEHRLLAATDGNANSNANYKAEVNTSDMGGAVKVYAGQDSDTIYLNQVDLTTGGSDRNFNTDTDYGVSAGPDAYNAVYVFNNYDPVIGQGHTVFTRGFIGATLDNDIHTGIDSFDVAKGVTGARGMYAVVNFKGFTSTAQVSNFTYDASKDGSVTAEQLNHAVIEAIAKSSVLSDVIVAKDGSGHSLIVESLINGEMTLKDLSVKFYLRDTAAGGSVNQEYLPEYYKEVYEEGKGIVTKVVNMYQTEFGSQSYNTKGFSYNIYNGNNWHVKSQAIVDAGEGNDLIVLGKNGSAESLTTITVKYGEDLTGSIRDGAQIVVNVDDVNTDGVPTGKSTSYISTYTNGHFGDFYAYNPSTKEPWDDPDHELSNATNLYCKNIDLATGNVTFALDSKIVKSEPVSISDAFYDVKPGEEEKQVPAKSIDQPETKAISEQLTFDLRDAIVDKSVLTIKVDGTEYKSEYKMDSTTGKPGWTAFVDEDDKPLAGAEVDTSNLKVSHVRVTLEQEKTFKLSGEYDENGDGKADQKDETSGSDATETAEGTITFNVDAKDLNPGNLLTFTWGEDTYQNTYKVLDPDDPESLGWTGWDLISSSKPTNPSSFRIFTEYTADSVVVTLVEPNVNSDNVVEIESASTYLGDGTGWVDVDSKDIVTDEVNEFDTTANTGRDIVELNGLFGNDALFDFESGVDQINAKGIGLTANPTAADANNLAANTAYVDYIGTAPKTGSVYTQDEVNKLVSDKVIQFTGAKDGVAVVFLDDGANDADNNVYTVVQVTKAAATVMGSLTLAAGDEIQVTDLIGVESDLLTDAELYQA